MIPKDIKVRIERRNKLEKEWKRAVKEEGAGGDGANGAAQNAKGQM